MNQMSLMIIYGPMAVGKLTVAEELCKQTSFKLFDNHKTVDMVKSLFDFVTPEYSQLIRKVRTDAFEAAARSLQGVAFTYTYSEADNDPLGFSPRELITHYAGVVKNFGGRVCPVQLTAPEDTLLSRVKNHSRVQRGKMADAEWLSQQLPTRNYFARMPLEPKDHPCYDTSTMQPNEVVSQIMDHYGLFY